MTGKGIRAPDSRMDLDCACWGKNTKELTGNRWGNANGNAEKTHGGNVWYKERNTQRTWVQQLSIGTGELYNDCTEKLEVSSRESAMRHMGLRMEELTGYSWKNARKN